MGGSGQVWSGQTAGGGGGHAGAMGTSGLCPKSCKRFGVKNTRRENLLAKNEGVWAKNGGWGLGKECILCQKYEFLSAKKNSSFRSPRLLTGQAGVMGTPTPPCLRAVL